MPAQTPLNPNVNQFTGTQTQNHAGEGAFAGTSGQAGQRPSFGGTQFGTPSSSPTGQATGTPGTSGTYKSESFGDMYGDEHGGFDDLSAEGLGLTPKEQPGNPLDAIHSTLAEHGEAISGIQDHLAAAPMWGHNAGASNAEASPQAAAATMGGTNGTPANPNAGQFFG